METLHEELYRVEKTYWWSASRRETVKQFYRLFRKKGDRDRVLDIGCGSGEMLEAMRGEGVEELFGIDRSILALNHLKRKEFIYAYLADATNLPFKDKVFDLVIILDVMEHLGDDFSALKEAHRVLKPGGMMIMTVPAFNHLWSIRDIMLDHKRRYGKRGLQEMLKECRFKIRKCSYFHFFYYPVMFFVINVRNVLQIDRKWKTDVWVVNRFLNTVFYYILLFETLIFKKLNFPFGVSILCVVERKN